MPLAAWRYQNPFVYKHQETSQNFFGKKEHKITSSKLVPTYLFCTHFGRHPFLRWWGVGVFSILESWGAVAASQQTFLLSPAPIQANTRGGDQNMQGIRC